MKKLKNLLVLKVIAWALIGNLIMFGYVKIIDKPFPVSGLILGTLAGPFLILPTLSILLFENFSKCITNCENLHD